MGINRLPAGWMLEGITVPLPAAITRRRPAASSTVPGAALIGPASTIDAGPRISRTGGPSGRCQNVYVFGHGSSAIWFLIAKAGRDQLIAPSVFFSRGALLASTVSLRNRPRTAGGE